MHAELNWHGHSLRIDFSAGRPLAIVLDPHGPQPSFFAGTPAQAEPLRNGAYVGDVDQGGSCNAEVLRFIPHCHGTHTECASHIDKTAGPVLDIIDLQPCLARLVTLVGTPAGKSGDHYPVKLDSSETILELDEMRTRTGDPGGPPFDALIIRTLPNEPAKMTRDYEQHPSYPVLSSEAIGWLADQDLKHLLLDTPSLDRADDSGMLANHRRWWGLDDSGSANKPEARRRSVTEMLYVPSEISDGMYWLNLELQPLVSDATSSRPVIYPTEILS